MPVIEDALLLARTGDVETFRALVQALKGKGYPQAFIEQHLDGRHIRAELRQAMLDARKAADQPAMKLEW